MADATHRCYNASDRSYYAIIKKDIHAIAVTLGFPDKRIAELDIVVAELTSNLGKFAKGGELLVGAFNVGNDEAYLELICIDQGPGMNDVSRMISDGYSSVNTLGHGLGSIKRLSDHFEIFSSKGWGSIILCRFFRKAPQPGARKKIITPRALVLAKPGETTSGDGYYVKQTGQDLKIFLGDGLGHGPEANFAMNEAVRAFKSCPYDSPVEILRFIHQAVRKTRGLVSTIAVVDPVNKKLKIAGIGNISTRIIGPIISKSHFAYNGIVGHNIPNTLNDQIYNLSDFNMLVMCSDGIRSRWDIDKHPAISRSDPSILAAAIYKDHARLTDDMSVVVTKL